MVKRKNLRRNSYPLTSVIWKKNSLCQRATRKCEMKVELSWSIFLMLVLRKLYRIESKVQLHPTSKRVKSKNEILTS